MVDNRVYALALALAIGLILFLDLGFAHVIMAVTMGYVAPVAQVYSGCRASMHQAQENRYGLIAIWLQSVLCLAGAATLDIGWRASGFAATTLIWDELIRAGWPLIATAPWVSAFLALPAIIAMLGLSLLRSGLRKTLMRACEAERTAIRAQPES